MCTYACGPWLWWSLPGGCCPPCFPTLALRHLPHELLALCIRPLLPRVLCSCLYEHYPRPKEFLLLYRIPEVLRRLLETQGRGADAVHQEAQRLLTAFQINVLF
ncbi:hypothetical protein V8C86DRAFT_352226 [Haematococcus lacustris]